MSSYFAFFIFISSQRKFWNTILASWIVTELINSHSIINFPSRPTRPPLCLFLLSLAAAPPLPGKAHETKKYHNTQDNREHNRTPCPTAPSAHASYKGYGCNNAKPPRPPYRNTMINVRLLGCIFWAKFGRQGGLIPWPNRDGRTELDRLSRSKNSTIPQSTVGGLLMFGELAGGRNGGPVCGDGN